MTLRQLAEQMQQAPRPKPPKDHYRPRHSRKPRGDGLPAQMLFDAAPDEAIRRREP